MNTAKTLVRENFTWRDIVSGLVFPAYFCAKWGFALTAWLASTIVLLFGLRLTPYLVALIVDMDVALPVSYSSSDWAPTLFDIVPIIFLMAVVGLYTNACTRIFIFLASRDTLIDKGFGVDGKEMRHHDSHEVEAK